MQPTKLAYSVDEVADMLDLHPNTVRKLVADGRLERIPNTGRAIRIAAAEIREKFDGLLGGVA